MRVHTYIQRKTYMYICIYMYIYTYIRIQSTPKSWNMDVGGDLCCCASLLCIMAKLHSTLREALEKEKERIVFTVTHLVLDELGEQLQETGAGLRSQGWYPSMGHKPLFVILLFLLSLPPRLFLLLVLLFCLLFIVFPFDYSSHVSLLLRLLLLVVRPVWLGVWVLGLTRSYTGNTRLRDSAGMSSHMISLSHTFLFVCVCK